MSGGAVARRDAQAFGRDVVLEYRAAVAAFRRAAPLARRGAAPAFLPAEGSAARSCSACQLSKGSIENAR
jgi:hypothetical protein